MTTESIVAITADKGIPKSKLDKLSKQTSLPLLTPKTQVDYLLHIATEHLELRKQNNQKNKKPNKRANTISTSIYVDFLEGKTNHRRLQGGGKGQDIAKAVGLNKIQDPVVLDLTAGMGGDAFVLATLGCQVTMNERNPVVHALLDDALSRANLSADHELHTILDRLLLTHSDASDLLNNLNENDLPDVIYLDPMFPERSKSAQVKKEMQFFHDIVGEDVDSEALLLASLNKAKKRIVVKRPRLAEKLTEEIEPAFVISGKSTRYDVYLPSRS